MTAVSEATGSIQLYVQAAEDTGAWPGPMAPRSGERNISTHLITRGDPCSHGVRANPFSMNIFRQQCVLSTMDCPLPTSQMLKEGRGQQRSQGAASSGPLIGCFHSLHPHKPTLRLDQAELGSGSAMAASIRAAHY